MAKISLEAAGRTLVLRYDIQCMLDIEETCGTMDDAQKRMAGKGGKRAETVLAVLCAMVNAGQRHEGKEPDVTVDWLRDNLTPAQFERARVLIQQAIIVGMQRECAADDDREVDAVLEELRKKKEQNSPGKR